jgi:cell division protein FtsB
MRKVSNVQWLLALGIVLLVLTGYTLVLGKGGLVDMWRMQRDIAAQIEQNNYLAQRNRELAGEVVNLQQGTAAIEERARSDLGLIRDGEIFVQVIE